MYSLFTHRISPIIIGILSIDVQGPQSRVVLMNAATGARLRVDSMRVADCQLGPRYAIEVVPDPRAA